MFLTQFFLKPTKYEYVCAVSFKIKYITDNTLMIKTLWLPLTPFTLGALKRSSATQTHKRPMLLMGKSLRHERGDVDEDSHETYFFVPSRPTIHTLMALSKKISRNTYDSRASFQHKTDTIEHSEKSVPIKYGTQVKTAHLKRSAVMARLTHSHFLYCRGVTCNKWFCARPLKTDYR